MMPLVLIHFKSGERRPVMSVPDGVVARISLRGARHLPDLGADAVHLAEVRAHALEHDAAVDVDHVRVPHLAAVDDIGHLHARPQFVGLRPNREDADVARLHILEYLARHVVQGPRGEIFENPGVVRATEARRAHGRARRRSRAQASSVISVTFSCGWMRRQHSTALRAPGVKFGVEG